MNSEENSDLDIDDLLRELDPDISPTKHKSNLKLTGQQAQAHMGETSTSDKFISNSKGNASHLETWKGGATANTGVGKSVRFSQNTQDDGTMDFSSVISKKPSSLLNSMFFSEDSKNTTNPSSQTTPSVSTVDSTAGKPIIPSSASSTKPTTSKKEVDWLGLNDNDEDNPFDLDTTFKQKHDPFTPTKKSEPLKKPQTDILDNFPEGFSLRWTSDDADNKPSSNPKQSAYNPLAVVSKPPIPPSARTKDKGLSATTSPRSPVLSRASSSESLNIQLQQTKKPSVSVNQNKNQSKIPESTPPISSSSILDTLPFLRNLSTSQTQQSRGPLENDSAGAQAQRASGDFGHGETMTIPSDQSRVQKKKIQPKTTTGNSNSQIVHTLQLPSHLVNEDELKAMSASLKALYANQLEMQEKSYKEQLEFFAAANKRKEDLLNYELNRLQEDYELRIQKLRDELSRNDAKVPHNLENELTNLSSHLERVTSKLDTIKESITTGERRTLSVDINYDKLKDIVNGELTRNLELSSHHISGQLEADLRKLESSINNSFIKCHEEQTVSAKKFEDVAVSQNKHLEQMTKNQQSLKESLKDSIVVSIEKMLERDRTSNQHQRNKMANQVKELRKDLRRLYFELENKNDVVHRSQINVEMEQRNINQSIRDINTFLKVSGGTKSSQGENNPNAAAIQLATMQAVQATVQNETEIKLLREERNSLSESIAQLNVERRKLADEKLALERDKMEFERERNRIRDVETASKARFSEAEDAKRESEFLRQQETKLSAEMQSKQQELSREKSKLKERLFEIEQGFMMKEQKLFLEKSEIVREREFVEKLRDQLLCPGCLKSAKGSSLFNLAPPPYHQVGRSSGDGTEFTTMPMNSIADLNRSIISGSGTGMPMPGKFTFEEKEKAYFLNENERYLKDLTKSLEEL